MTLRDAITTLAKAATPSRRRLFVLTLALMLVGALAELATIGAVIPFLALIADPGRAEGYVALRWLGDLVSGGRDGLIMACAGALILIAIAAGAIRLALTWLNLKFVLLYGHDLGRQIFARQLRQPYFYFVTRNSSDALASIEKLSAVVFGVLLPVMQGVAAGIISIFIVACLFLLNPVAATSAGGILGLTYLIVTLATRRRLRRNSEALGVGATGRIKVVQEGLGGIRDILIDGSQAVFEQAFARLDYQYRRAQAVNNLIALAPRYLVETSAVVLIALLTVYFARQPGGLVGAIPVLGALAIGAQRLLPMMHLAYTGWTSFAGSHQLILDVAELLRTPIVEARLLADRRTIAPFTTDIVVDDVTFRYLAREDALKGVSLRIAKGERIGFVGRTGSGKSTLIDLLMGLLPPTAGSIRIDGVALTDDNLSEWQAKIAHVPQAIYLSDSSIAANIAFGETDDEIDLARVREAARRAEIDDFIVTQPEGYDTPVGERGVRLSGGQRQRIGIARALYKGASVLIFDEATSALDEPTEAAIMASIERLPSEVTLLMIAHRLSTLAGCDRIVKLDKGRIVDVSPGGRAKVI